MSDDTPKWTEIEHLPEWDEEFYHVYTAKKHGKWVMLKTLRPEFKESPQCQSMIEKEFDTRYNLAHPNIVMINDFEDVPGVGLSIICDDVYGSSLRTLIDQKKVTSAHIEKLRTSLPSALQYIQENRIAHHPLRPETVIFTENVDNLKLIDVGFEQRPHLSPKDASEDMAAYGRVLLAALDACSEPQPQHLRRVAEKCVTATPQHSPYRDVTSLRLALDHRRTDRLYLLIIAFLVAMIACLLWFTVKAPV